MKKRTLSIFLIAIMVISLVACGTSKKEDATTTSNNVVETTKEAVETPPEPEVPAPVISANGITVDGEIGDVANVSANEVDLAEFADLSTYLSDKTTGTVVYDITTLDKDGNAVQPEGNVNVTVDTSAIASSGNGYVVYYVAPEGTFEKMNVVSSTDTSVTFATTHFSVYVVGAYDAATIADTDFAANSETAVPAVTEYTYKDVSQTMYAKSSVNVRNLPGTDGTKLGGLSTNNEVIITGVCNETGWYRIEYKGGVAYVSNSYIVSEKVVEQPTPATPAPSGIEQYGIGVWNDMGDWFVYISPAPGRAPGDNGIPAAEGGGWSGWTSAEWAIPRNAMIERGLWTQESYGAMGIRLKDGSAVWFAFQLYNNPQALDDFIVKYQY